MATVLDASVFVSAISPTERLHREALALYRSLPPPEPFVVPAVFRLEVVAALTRRRELDAALEAADALVRGNRFAVDEVDASLVDAATAISRKTGLRAYDALYVATADRLGAELLTLDADLVLRVRRELPHLRVRDRA